jgi:hypothetical protein
VAGHGAASAPWGSPAGTGDDSRADGAAHDLGRHRVAESLIQADGATVGREHVEAYLGDPEPIPSLGFDQTDRSFCMPLAAGPTEAQYGWVVVRLRPSSAPRTPSQMWPTRLAASGDRPQQHPWRLWPSREQRREVRIGARAGLLGGHFPGLDGARDVCVGCLFKEGPVALRRDWQKEDGHGRTFAWRSLGCGAYPATQSATSTVGGSSRGTRARGSPRGPRRHGFCDRVKVIAAVPRLPSTRTCPHAVVVAFGWLTVLER